MTAPSDQCAFSGWMEISGPQSGWGKPKISLTSWAWAVWDSLHPWPPRVSESTSVCRNSVLCAGHGRQNRTPGASRAGVQLPAGTSPPMGAPQSCRAWQEGRGSPCPFPLLDTASSFASSSPFPICRPWRCVQEQVRALPGPAKQRLHRASPVRGQRPGQAGAWGPGGAVRTPHPAPLYPVPTSFLTSPDIPSISHCQQKVGAVLFEMRILP